MFDCHFPVYSLFPELGSTTDKPFQPSVKPTELIKFPTGTTTARGDTGGETKGAEGAPKVEDDNTKKKKKKNKKKKKKPRGSEDVALDIRPELAQAKDILVWTLLTIFTKRNPTDNV